jgi:hypothetical protein
MYLIFKTIKEAKERSLVEGFRRGLGDKQTTRYWWGISYEYEDGRAVLNVGDGNGLSEEELNNCVNEINIDE